MKYVINLLILIIVSAFSFSCDKDDEGIVELDRRELIGVWERIYESEEGSMDSESKSLIFTEDKVVVINGDFCSDQFILGKKDTSTYQYYTYKAEPNELNPTIFSISKCGKEYSIAVQGNKLNLIRTGSEGEEFTKSTYLKD